MFAYPCIKIEIRIKISIGHDEKNVNDADAIVYSSAIPSNNPEIIFAKNKFQIDQLYRFITLKMALL